MKALVCAILVTVSALSQAQVAKHPRDEVTGLHEGLALDRFFFLPCFTIGYTGHVCSWFSYYSLYTHSLYPWYGYEQEPLPWVKGKLAYPNRQQPADLQEVPFWTPAERELYDWEGTYREARPDPLIRKAIRSEGGHPPGNTIWHAPDRQGEERKRRGRVDMPQPDRSTTPDPGTRSPFGFP